MVKFNTEIPTNVGELFHYLLKADELGKSSNKNQRNKLIFQSPY